MTNESNPQTTAAQFNADERIAELEAERDRLLKALDQFDGMQCYLNRGEYCLHIEDDGRFCGRARGWFGHLTDGDHKFVGQYEGVKTTLEVEFGRSQRENTILRGLLAKQKIPCIHCGLEDMSRCPRGFPGCAQADDLLCGEDEAWRGFAEQYRKMKWALDAWQVAFCHQKCVAGILGILEEEYPGFVNECKFAMEAMEKAG